MARVALEALHAKFGHKAAAESGIVVTTGLVNQIIMEGESPVEWELSNIVKCFNGKGDALKRENRRVRINRSDSEDSILISK